MQDAAFVGQWANYSAWENLSPTERQAIDPRLVAAQTAELLGSMRASPQTSLALVAEVAGRPVGYALAAVHPDPTTMEPQGYFYDLFVVPQLRRQGIGRSLQQAAERMLAGAGLRKVKMWSDLSNPAATKMAAASGFKPEGLIHAKEW